jgi:hypothetical protein
MKTRARVFPTFGQAHRALPPSFGAASRVRTRGATSRFRWGSPTPRRSPAATTPQGTASGRPAWLGAVVHRAAWVFHREDPGPRELLRFRGPESRSGHRSIRAAGRAQRAPREPPREWRSGTPSHEPTSDRGVIAVRGSLAVEFPAAHHPRDPGSARSFARDRAAAILTNGAVLRAPRDRQAALARPATAENARCSPAALDQGPSWRSMAATTRAPTRDTCAPRAASPSAMIV